MAERLGQWPSLVGWVVICLIPKADGGRRPIGLLPCVVRLWMRIRLEVAQAWQCANDRPFFYAGPRKGADVAALKQAARAELAATSSHMDWACGLLDLVKAFERVPHDWLVKQAVKYRYPLIVLRLNLAAYRLGVFSLLAAFVLPSCGVIGASSPAQFMPPPSSGCFSSSGLSRPQGCTI